MIQRVLTILYLIFYITISGLSVFDTSPTADPLWLRIVEGLSSGVAVICILLYLTHTRPNSLRVLFKIIPIAIVLVDLFSNSYALLSPAPSHYPAWFPIFITILLALTLFPSWYICFRFGYLDEFKNTDPQTFKKLATYAWWYVLITLFIPVLFGNPMQQKIAVDVARVMGSISLVVVLYQRRKARTKTNDAGSLITSQKLRTTPRVRKW